MPTLSNSTFIGILQILHTKTTDEVHDILLEDDLLLNYLKQLDIETYEKYVDLAIPSVSGREELRGKLENAFRRFAIAYDNDNFDEDASYADFTDSEGGHIIWDSGKFYSDDVYDRVCELAIIYNTIY